MEIYKPLKDWELSCLAERMSPLEFDQIAIRYMEIRKVCVLLLSHRYKTAYLFQSEGIPSNKKKLIFSGTRAH